ncbi:rhodanese-like domain-containing protein [Nocardioides sp. URHA0020]|uniref:rhodanese-like domain-containing protein n=1 Tax=Nocardioides sp. URHA0020 TaxID=1380392 RepID=UPI0004907D08|nr:rhodanese-like domain-containing protein [Nocardioides sp. URHA0020]
MQVLTLEIPELGNHTHLVHDGRYALVVDPPRDIAPVEAAAEAAGVEISTVADTHLHNDYLSGALALARRHGADYLLAADESVTFERVGVRGGDVLTVGSLDVSVLATPGHTRHHQAFSVRDRRGSEPAAVFSGGSLLHGTVGRTDLVDPRLQHDLARAQWASARLIGGLDPATRLRPTHGFGSLCAGSRTSAETDGTIGGELAVNPALLLDRDRFVDELVAGFGAIPSYYGRMAPLNRTGAGRARPRPGRAVTRDEVADAILARRWVVDLRPRASFARGHVPGSVSVEYSAQFATYVGWLVPGADDLVLLYDTADDVGAALHDLAGIGIDGPGIHGIRADESLPATLRRTDWAGFREHVGPRVVVDVRERDEYDAGHLPEAVHLPVHEIERGVVGLPAGELWAHCRSGYRAGIAASLLHRAGRSVVHVDDSWDLVAGLAVPTTAAA